MQPLQDDFRDPAAKDTSITNAATARSNFDAAIAIGSAETELQNTIELRATASEIVAPTPEQKKLILDRKWKQPKSERSFFVTCMQYDHGFLCGSQQRTQKRKLSDTGILPSATLNERRSYWSTAIQTRMRFTTTHSPRQSNESWSLCGKTTYCCCARCWAILRTELWFCGDAKRTRDFGFLQWPQSELLAL